MSVLSYISFRKDTDSALFGSVAIFNSQPTRCGHTLRGVHNGAGEWLRPFEPCKGKSHEA